MDECDFAVIDHGTIIAIVPMSEAAHEWVDENVHAEPWQWLGGALCIDHGCADALLAVAIADGLTWEEEE